METEHKIFFAIPFDSATKRLYERVCRKIRKRFPRVTTEIGSEEVGPSPEYSSIASFKAQNRELTKQFVNKIREADIIVADLTHNNPNVHVELGMALLNNKNILRVTGRSLTELGFDIRNLEVQQYEDEAGLTKRILDYCDIFLKIKTLPISSEHGPLYFKESRPMQLHSSGNIADLRQIGAPTFRMRDGAIRVGFELTHADSEQDWFGIYFRVGTHPFLGSHLLYVRRNGQMEIALYPGAMVLDVRDAHSIGKGRHELTVEFENNHLHAKLGDADLRVDKLSHQTVGSVWLGAWNATVGVGSVEMICRDTIESD